MLRSLLYINYPSLEHAIVAQIVKKTVAKIKQDIGEKSETDILNI